MSQIGDREDTIMPGGIAMLLQHHVDAGGDTGGGSGSDAC